MAYLFVAAVIAVVGIAWLVKTSLAARPPKLNFPVVGNPGDPDFRSAIIEGVKKVRFDKRLRSLRGERRS